MAAVASLPSRSLDQDSILTPCGRSSYWTCQTPTPHLAELQMNYARGTLAHTEGMHTGLVRLVQSAKALQNYHCELCEIRIPPEYQAASSVLL